MILIWGAFGDLRSLFSTWTPRGSDRLTFLDYRCALQSSAL